MAILVVGSVGYDTVETAAGSRKDALGGSATFFSVSGSYFAPVGMVAVVGDDFTADSVDLLKSHRVDVSGLQRAPGKTFRWSGVYGRDDVNSRETLDTQLNVFADFDPRLSPEHRSLPYLFLANIDPELQLNVLGQMEQRPRLVAADTMNFWIDGKLDALSEVVRSVDVLFVDENEIRQFAAAHVGAVNVVRAARFIQNMGPETVIVKRGDHGLIQFMGDSIFAAPAYPAGHGGGPHRRRRLLRRGVHRVPGRHRRPGPRGVSTGRRRGVGHGLLRGGVLQRRAPGRFGADGHRRPVPGLRQHQPVPWTE